MTSTVHSFPISAPEAQAAVQLAHRAAEEHSVRYGGERAATPEEGDWIHFTVDNGMVTSLCLWRIWCSRVCICQAWTMPNYRRRGLYHTLVASIRARARIDCVGVIAFIDPKNVASHAVHAKLGFRNTWDNAWELLPRWGTA